MNLCITTDHMGADIHLARRQEFAIVNRNCLRQQRFPVMADMQPVRLEENIEIGRRIPSLQLSASPKRCRPRSR